MLKPNIPKILQSLYLETAQQKVVDVLFRYPDKEFSLSDLAKEARVAKQNISTILEKLYKADIIKITKLKTLWRIQTNQQHPEVIKHKIVMNLHFIYQSGVVEFLESQFHHPKSIILFGSFRRGEDISSSDIDIAIELDEQDEYATVHVKEFAGIERQIGKKITAHLFNRKHIDLHVFNNITNGIVLSGFLEVRP